MNPLILTTSGGHRISADQIKCNGDGIIVATLRKGETVAVIAPGQTEWQIDCAFQIPERRKPTKEDRQLMALTIALLNSVEGRKVLKKSASPIEISKALHDFHSRNVAARIERLEKRIAEKEAQIAANSTHTEQP